MSALDDGGPAFSQAAPRYLVDVETGDKHLVPDGMSLRDAFALAVLSRIALRFSDEDIEKAARMSYRLADAAIKARKESVD